MSNVGAVIFANNVDSLNYTHLAEFAADKISRHLEIPVTIISDENIASKYSVIGLNYNKHNIRYLTDYGKTTWLNMGRTRALELSPYDRTLVLDADYIINTDTLKTYLNTPVDFAIAREMYDPTTGNAFTVKLGSGQIDQCWATVMIFEKSNLAEKIFQLAEHVLNHYSYYHRLYDFKPAPLRNDYAFSIACHLLGGYGQLKFDMPGFQMVNCDFDTSVELVEDNSIVVSKLKNISGKTKRSLLRIHSDVHIQHKVSLLNGIYNV